nr:cadherin-like beta sandwich domain-containing protein [uncultured Mucilaginibacter sp.]
MNLILIKTAYMAAVKKNRIDFTRIALIIIGICLFTGFTGANAAGTKKVEKASFISTNARLANLTVSAGTLSPSFSALQPTYTDTIGNAITSVTVTATKEQSGAAITINGISVASGTASASLPMAVGDNTITIIATAEDGTTKKTYTVTVRRLNNNTSLDIVGFSLIGIYGTVSPDFSNSVNDYTIANNLYPADGMVRVVIHKTNDNPNVSITIPQATVRYPESNGFLVADIPIHEGTNVIAMVITAEDRVTTKTLHYTIYQNYNNADLSKLAYDSNSNFSIPSISAGATSYLALTSPGVNSIYLGPKTADPQASVKINGVAVSNGQKTVNYPVITGGPTATVVVTARDGVTTKTYIVNARQKRPALLAGITFSAGRLSPAFSTGSTQQSYKLYIRNTVNNFQVNVTSKDTSALIEDFDRHISNTGSITYNLNGPTMLKFRVSTVDEAKDYTIEVIRESTNANLADISSRELSPAFSPEVTDYRLTVYQASTSYYITPADFTATIKIKLNGAAMSYNGYSSLNYFYFNIGENTINITVTAQDTTVKRVYTIVVKREPDKAELYSIYTSVGALSPYFNATTGNYQVNVAGTTSSIKIKPYPSDHYPNATAKVNGVSVALGAYSAAIPLNLGNNQILVVVTSADLSKTFTDTLNVTRQSNDTNLAGLSISPGHLSPAFVPGTFNYEAFLTNATISVNITATRANANQKITVHGVVLPAGTSTFNEPLTLGTNVVEIVVASQDGSKSNTYVLFITRPSNNSNLRNLSVTDASLSPAFSINTLNYTASVPHDYRSIKVRPYAENSNAPITVNGIPVYSNNFSPPIPLELGPNTISVVVTSQDSSKVRTYKIVVRRLSDNTNLAGITLSSGALSPAFAPGTFSYTSSVSNATSSLTVKPVAVNGHAAMKVNGVSIPFGGTSASLPLAVGNNTITVTTTSEDLSRTRTYTITVNRAPATFAVASNTKPDISPKNRLNVADNLSQPVVRQAVSPNGDGVNDILLIDGVEGFADNTLKIMNRDGNLVFEKAKYDNTNRGFDGHSGVNSKLLPAGTYFYSFEYTPEGSRAAKRKTGFFILKY